MACEADSRRQLTREKRIGNYRISRGRRVVENVFEILASRFRASLGTMKQRPKVVRDIVLMCGVAQHADDTPGWRRQGTHPCRLHMGGGGKILYFDPIFWSKFLLIQVLVPKFYNFFQSMFELFEVILTSNFHSLNHSLIHSLIFWVWGLCVCC